MKQAGFDRMYLVSAIVSTYNSEHFLQGCLDDLLRQTIADKLEIIVVNSGSEQNEEAVVRRYQQRYSNIVYIETEQREGIYAAWNRAVKVAHGQFLTNANTDDRHRRDALEILANALAANPDVALVYGDQIVSETPNATFENPRATEWARRPDYSRRRLLLGCCVGSQPMWRKSLHDEFGLFDENLTCAGDWDFWIRISAKYRLLRIPEFLGLYYHNRRGIEHGHRIHSLYERYAVGKKYGTEYISTIPFCKADDCPLVSVIMPAYNAEDYIAQAIESVLVQSYRNFELIVIDDGSTDRTRDVVSAFNDEKIRYFYRENGGLPTAINEGIAKSRGPYIIKLDSDDMMLPDFIVRHLRQFSSCPDADLLYCDDVLIDPDNKVIRVINYPEYTDTKHLIRDIFRCGYPIAPFRDCIRRAVFDRIGLYDEQLSAAEDYDMMRRFTKAHLKVRQLKEPLYLRRIHPDSLCKNPTPEKTRDHFSVIQRIIDTFSCHELFPDVNWAAIPQSQIDVHAKCLIGATLLAIAQNYSTANQPFAAELGLSLARKVLEECLSIDPNHQKASQLLRDCESLGRNLTPAAAGTVCGKTSK